MKAGLQAKTARFNLSARRYRSANPSMYILAPDSQPIRENENRLDSEKLMLRNRFLSCRTDILKEASTSIKFIDRMSKYTYDSLSDTVRSLLIAHVLYKNMATKSEHY